MKLRLKELILHIFMGIKFYRWHCFQFSTCQYCQKFVIVVKGYQIPSFQTQSPISQNLLSFTLTTNRPSQVFFINRNTTVKLSSINTIHVKLQHNVGFFIFKFLLKYMLGNSNIYICLYYREGSSHVFSFFCCIQKNPSRPISKLLGRKYFQWSNFQLIPVCYYGDKKIHFN